MCEFISWKEYKGNLYFLTKDVIKNRLLEYKKWNPRWLDDICGHGAIEYFFDLPSQCGTNKECTDFSTPDNFPSEIVEAIKYSALHGIGICLPILTKPARAKYETVKQTAWAEYRKVKKPAWAKYETVEQTAWAEYETVKQTARAKYETVKQTAWAEYRKVKKTAWAEYSKVDQTAWAEYETVKQTAFWKIVRIKKNRVSAWK